MAAVHRDLHRRLRTGARHVREQLPARRGHRQLWRDLERLQAHRRRLFRRRKTRAVFRYGGAGLPDRCGGAAMNDMSPVKFEYDPYAPEVLQNPLPFYRELLANHPGYYVEKYDMYVFTRFQDILDVLG